MECTGYGAHTSSEIRGFHAFISLFIMDFTCRGLSESCWVHSKTLSYFMYSFIFFYSHTHLPTPSPQSIILMAPCVSVYMYVLMQMGIVLYACTLICINVVTDLILFFPCFLWALFLRFTFTVMFTSDQWLLTAAEASVHTSATSYLPILPGMDAQMHLTPCHRCK